MSLNRFRLAMASVRARILFGFALITLIVLGTVGAGYAQLAQVRNASEQVFPTLQKTGPLQLFAVSISSFEGNLDSYFNCWWWRTTRKCEG